MDEITKILEKIYYNEELRQTIVPLFLSDPGQAKSTMVKEFAEREGVKMVKFVVSQRVPMEVSGLAMPDKDTKRMSFWDFDTLLEMKDGDILFFDEVLNGNPAVLNACLTILEDREMISGKKLPKIMIVAAANPQGMIPLTPQIKQRFIWYILKFNKIGWINKMIKKYGITKTIGEKLSGLILKESFSGGEFNYYSSRSIDKNINMILHKAPTPYEKIIKPILEELIINTTENDITLKDGSTFLKGEAKKWIDIIRIEKEIK